MYKYNIVKNTTMVVHSRIFRHRHLILTFSLLLMFFLLKKTQTVTISTNIESLGPSKRDPGAYIMRVHPTPSNTSYCKLNYGLPYVLNYAKSDLSGSPEMDKDSPYHVIYDVLKGSIGAYEPGVTYATHVTTNYVVFVSEILRYWEGPVSVAAYLPDGDPRDILEQFLNLCYCIPGMSRLSLHLVFRADVRPMDMYPSNAYIPPKTCDIRNLTTVKSRATFKTNDASNNEEGHSLNSWYPINVCRNAARQAAYTKYVMVCDVELIPSQGLARRFIDMMEIYKCTKKTCLKRVFVVPIFEVEAAEQVPRVKAQLLQLLKQERAVYFHQLTCRNCQRFPGLDQWKETDPGDTLKSLLETRREIPYHTWEPIYIGTKEEPMYHEMLSWEGFQDKMLQMVEMCLARYTLVILDGAFLVHWPGMKKVKSKVSEPWRETFQNVNQKHYDLILERLETKYPPNPLCRVVKNKENKLK